MVSFEKNLLKKIGLGLTGFGVFFSFLGVIFLFDKGLLVANMFLQILFVSGVSLTIGFKPSMLFVTKRQNFKGTIFFGVGVFFVVIGWRLIGMMLETYGFFILLSGFWPTLSVFAQMIPILGPYIRSMNEHVVVEVPTEFEHVVELLEHIVLEEILTRVPIECLARSKSICNDFYLRSYDLNYVHRHLDLSRERFLRLDRMVRVIDPVEKTDRSSPLPQCINHTTFIETMIHCDGLVLIRNPRRRHLNLWNPLTGQMRLIEPSCDLSPDDAFGVGYSTKCRGCYKVLHIKREEMLQMKEDKNQRYAVKIYEPNTMKWRSIHALLDWEVERSCPGLSIKGNMYWIARDNGESIFIQSFNVSKKTFRSICSFSHNYDMEDTNALSVYKGYGFSLLHQRHGSTKIDFWITNALSEDVVSWTHLFRVDTPDLPELRHWYDIAYPTHFINEDRAGPEHKRGKPPIRASNSEGHFSK